MAFTKKLTALSLSAGLLMTWGLSAQTMALSADQVPVSPKAPVRLADWINAHPKASVEFRYPGMGQSTLLADATTDEIGTIEELRNGTPVIIRLTETVTSENATSGTNVNFQVVGDVKIRGKVLIRAGELGNAQVTTVEENGYIGKAGKIVISDFSVRAIDGTFVPLRATLSDKGAERLGASIAVGYLFCPLFLLMKGGKASLPAGTERTVYVAADVDVVTE